MKITSNAVGNYSPSYMKPSAVNGSEEVRKNGTENFSLDEKKFFAKLYPDQKSEVMEYKSYNSKGKISGVHVGSLFDRRG